MKFYIGPWFWDAKSTIGPHWRAPDGASCIVDLRPVPAQGLTATVSGFGVFASDADLDSDYRFFGDGKSLTDTVSNDRDVFASMCGVNKVDGDSLAEWLFTLTTLYADPLGDTAIRPLMPVDGKVLRAFGIETPFLLASPEAAGVIENIKNDYRKIRAASLDGKLGPDDLQHRRVLDFLGKQYGVENPQDVFIPDDLPKETPVLHATTIQDDFTRADAGSLGTATVGGVSQGWSWTPWAVESTGGTPQNDSDFSIVSNIGTVAGSAPRDSKLASAGGALSSSDHYAQMTTKTVGDVSTNYQIGPVVRNPTGADFTGYFWRSVPIISLGFFLEKSASNGVFTNIGSNNSVQVANDKVMRLTANGSSIVGRYDGSDLVSVTDTTITGNVNTGIFGFTPNTFFTQFYAFSASDLGGGADTLWSQSCM